MTEASNTQEYTHIKDTWDPDELDPRELADRYSNGNHVRTYRPNREEMLLKKQSRTFDGSGLKPGELANQYAPMNGWIPAPDPNAGDDVIDPRALANEHAPRDRQTTRGYGAPTKRGT